MKNRLQKILGVALLFVLPFAAHAQETAEGIVFEHGTWEEALQKAKSEGKLLFVDVWATWCGPCKRLATEVFTDKEVASFFNTHFVCYKLLIDEKDDALREKNQNLARTYNAMALPTLLWINAEGKAEHFSTGYKPAEEILKEAQKALDPDLRASHITDNWAGQPHTLENGIVYFTANREATAEFDEFFLALSPEEQRDERIEGLLFSSMTLPADSKALHYMAAREEWQGMVESQLRRLLGAVPLDEEDALADQFASYNLPFLARLKDDIRCLKLFRFERIGEAFALGQKMVSDYADTSLDFVGNFVDVAFFVATRQHVVFTPEQKNMLLDWAKQCTGKMGEKENYRKYFILFEACALVGKDQEAKENMVRLKEIVGGRFSKEDERQNALKFYDDLELSAKEIR